MAKNFGSSEEFSNTMAALYYKYRLQRNYTAILQDLEPKKVVNILFQEEVFDADDMADVKCEKTRKKQAEVLLEKLDNQGHSKVAIFVHALRKIQPHLYELLQTQVPGEEEALIASQVQANAGLCIAFLLQIMANNMEINNNECFWATANFMEESLAPFE